MSNKRGDGFWFGTTTVAEKVSYSYILDSYSHRGLILRLCFELSSATVRVSPSDVNSLISDSPTCLTQEQHALLARIRQDAFLSSMFDFVVQLGKVIVLPSLVQQRQEPGDAIRRSVPSHVLAAEQASQ